MMKGTHINHERIDYENLIKYIKDTNDSIGAISKQIDAYLKKYGRDKWKLLEPEIDMIFNERINISRELESRHTVNTRISYIKAHVRR